MAICCRWQLQMWNSSCSSSCVLTPPPRMSPSRCLHPLWSGVHHWWNINQNVCVTALDKDRLAAEGPSSKYHIGRYCSISSSRFTGAKNWPSCFVLFILVALSLSCRHGRNISCNIWSHGDRLGHCPHSGHRPSGCFLIPHPADQL